MFAGPLGRSTFTPPKSSFDSPLYGLVSLRRSHFFFLNHGFSLSLGCQHPSRSEDFLAGAAADDTNGFKFGVVGISSLPAEAFRSVFRGGRLRYPDTARIVGRGGSMIRHAGAAAAFPVGPLPVAVIEPSLPALLVPPVGGPPLAPPRFPPAALAAVLVPPVTMTTDPEHHATAGPPAEPPP